MTARRGPVVVRDCQHTQVRHEHGTPTAYKRDRCRCTPCSDAQNVEDRQRRLDNYLGAPRRIDAGPVREHIAVLREAGIGYRQLAALAEVSPSTISKLTVRDPNRKDGLPQQKITPQAAEKILAVRASLENVTDGGLIDATGTLRRVQALHALGWSRRAISIRLGVRHNALTQIGRRGRVTGRMARAVRDVYDDLWDEQPPAATHQERAAITVTLGRAAAHQWPVPAMWDDDQLDDPTAVPASVKTGVLPAVARLDEVQFLIRSGANLHDAARRAGYASWPVAQRLASRHGHPVAGTAERLVLERAA